MDSVQQGECSGRAELDRLIEAALQWESPTVPAGQIHVAEGADDGVEPWLPVRSAADVLAAGRRLREATRVERRGAPALALRLERHPETRARLLIDHKARFQTWGLCEELLDRSHRSIFDKDPHRAVRQARLATAVAARVSEEVYRAGLAIDLRARAWAGLGNAYRCANRPVAAAAALDRAEELLEEGSGDPLEAAAVASFRASLTLGHGELDAAAAALDRAEAIYAELDEDLLRGKILIQRSYVAGYRDATAGVPIARAAERSIDPAEDPRLHLLARHAHVFWLVESGEPERARMLLDASRSLYRKTGERWFEILLIGLEARLHLALGDFEAAEAGLRTVLAAETERELHVDAAVTAIELAACRLARGDSQGAAEIAATMAPLLREWGAHRHAREAWSLFQHALSIERAGEDLMREIKSYLRLAWKNPRRRFDQSIVHRA